MPDRYVLRLVAAVLTVTPLLFAPWLHWLALVLLVAIVPAAWLITRGRDILLGIVGGDEEFRAELKQSIRMSKVRRWRDHFATSDPVPEGALPLRHLGLERTSSTQMVNLRSPFFDHTSYWQNAEGFRPAMLEELAARLGWPFTPVFAGRVVAGQATRARSAYVLAASAWLFGGLALSVSIVGLLGPAWFGLWDDVGSRVGPVMAWLAGLFNGAVQKWLKRDPGHDAATAACVVVVCAAAYTLVMVIWQQSATRRGARVLKG